MKIRTMAALVLGLATATAFGQLNVAKPGYVKIGYGYPVSSTVRDDVSKSALQLALGYDLPKPLFLSALPGRTSVELGYSHINGNGATVDNYTLQLVHRLALSQAVEGKGLPYVGLGLGVRYGHVDGGGTNPLPTGGYASTRSIGNVTGSTNQTQVTATGILGYDITSMFFVEAAYNLSPTIDSLHTDTLSLSVGVRF